MVQHTCTVCGAPFESRTKLAKYCSKPCNWKAFNAARIADGRLAEYRAKNRERRNVQAKIYKLEWTPCAVCGALVQHKTAHKRQFVCGHDCRSYLRFGKWPSTEIPWQHPIRSTLVPLDHPTRAIQITLKPRFMCGQCSMCGRWFIADKQAYSNFTELVCSRPCSKRKHRLIRRARLADVVVEEVHPYKVYLRDAWMCYLCGDLVDKKAVVPSLLAPTLDHVVPIAAGGSHTLANVKTAHFICNSLKRDQELQAFLDINVS